MIEALRYFRGAIGDFYFDLPRAVLLNFFWFITALPLLFVIFVAYTVIRSAPVSQWGIFAFQAVLPSVLTLALAGPGTAAIYHVTNRLANGELLEVSRFWPAFRRYFWRGWLLALADVGTGALLALNVWFYWWIDRPGLWLLSVVFAYLLLLWYALQSYVFALMVELDQGIRRVVRNALYLVIDNLGLTLGLALANTILLLATLATGAGLLLVASMAVLAIMHNKAVVGAVAHYRATGRMTKEEHPKT